MQKERYSGTDLSRMNNSLAGILTKIMPQLSSMRSISEVEAVCHQEIDPYVGHGISEQTSRKFFYALGKARSLTGAYMVVSQFMLAGSGLATYGGE